MSSTLPSTPFRPSQTKIVATIGPASEAPPRLRELIQAGVDVFRVNTAHGTLAEHQQHVDAVRAVSHELGVPVAILVDLPGPKMRLNEVPGGAIECLPGSTLRFVRGSQPAQPGELTTTYAPLIDELHVGDRVLLADGTVALAVEQVDAEGATCRVVQGGTLRNRQGVNLPGIKLSAATFAPDDRTRAQWAIEAGADFLGLSFVRSPDDVQQLKDFIAARLATAPLSAAVPVMSGPQVIAKIEKSEAVAQLAAIVAVADGIMVARGDLGVETDIAQLPMVQKQIVAACRAARKPVIIATQMLDSMQNSRLPTRAEATDVANAIMDGADACMLSGETAIGKYPREAVEMMHRIALSTESMLGGHGALAGEAAPTAVVPAAGLPAPNPISDAITEAAGWMAEQLDAKVMVVASVSGQTALSVAKCRFRMPTIGVSHHEATLRRMCLYWGIIPLSGVPAESPRHMLDYVCDRGRQDGWLTAGDRMVFVFGLGLSSSRHNGVLVYQLD